MRASGASSRAFAARRSTPPVTDSSRASTGPRAPFAAPTRSRGRARARDRGSRRPAHRRVRARRRQGRGIRRAHRRAGRRAGRAGRGARLADGEGSRRRLRASRSRTAARPSSKAFRASGGSTRSPGTNADHGGEPASRRGRSRSSSRTSRARPGCSTASARRNTGTRSASTSGSCARRSAGTTGYEVDTAGDGFFYAFATAAGAARAVGEALGGAGRRPDPDPGRHPHRRADRRAAEVRRDRRAPGGADHGGGARRPGAPQPNDPRPARRELSPSAISASTASRTSPRRSGSSSSGRASSRGRGRSTSRTFRCRRRSSSAASASSRRWSRQLRNGVRLLTLTGPGGTGKTRLALQAAAEAADDFADGVWWVPLAALRDPALVLRHTARTLDVIEQPDRPLEEVLAEMLNGKRMLLVLDNAEHLLPDAADAIATLRDLDGPKLVVTSRERLQLTGEHVYPVPQLTPPEGLDLFAARAAAIDPAFETDPAVAELCEPPRQPAARDRARRRPHRRAPARADPGAARQPPRPAQGRAATPTRASRRCARRSRGRTTSSPRRSASSARRFSVFAGGATLEAVEEVCEADLDTLASLVDKSLLRHDGDRFWMLETIREYGTRPARRRGRART